MAKQFALEDSFGEPARVHRDHGLRGASGEEVKGLGYDLLAGAVLAGDEHVGIRRTDARDQVAHGLHRPRLGNQLGPFGAQQPVFSLQALPLAQRLAELNLSAKNRDQPRVVPGFLHEVARASPHRLDGHFHAAPRRHNHHGQRAVQGLNTRQHVQPLLAGRRVARVIQVHEKAIEV